MYSGITSGRVLNGELLYTKILEVNLFAFAHRLFRRDFSPLDGTYCRLFREVPLHSSRHSISGFSTVFIQNLAGLFIQTFREKL